MDAVQAEVVHVQMVEHVAPLAQNAWPTEDVSANLEINMQIYSSYKRISY